MTTIPRRQVFADVVEQWLADHTDWDSLHQFVTLHWDGDKVTPGIVAMIDPSMPPHSYPDLMASVVKDAIAKQLTDGEHTLYAFLLLFEAHAVREPETTASAEETEQFHRDRLGRTFHQRPDAVEIAGVYCVDVHGRLWTAAKRRDKPGEIERHFHATPDGAPGGRFITGLRQAAETTLLALHQGPIPPSARDLFLKDSR